MARIDDKIYLQKMKDGMNIIDNKDKDIKNYVAIFDIDDTILYPYKNKIIKPIYDLYKYSLQNNVYTVFITAREGNKYTMKYTLDQLKNLGIRGYDLLYFRPPHITDIKQYKLFSRMNVINSGYKPLFSIGDMYWDVGSFGGIPIEIK
jgi:predicted secreted acid phosphatase